jgi:hypothetical protein
MASQWPGELDTSTLDAPTGPCSAFGLRAVCLPPIAGSAACSLVLGRGGLRASLRALASRAMGKAGVGRDVRASAGWSSERGNLRLLGVFDVGVLARARQGAELRGEAHVSRRAPTWVRECTGGARHETCAGLRWVGCARPPAGREESCMRHLIQPSPLGSRREALLASRGRELRCSLNTPQQMFWRAVAAGRLGVVTRRSSALGITCFGWRRGSCFGSFRLRLRGLGKWWLGFGVNSCGGSSDKPC